MRFGSVCSGIEAASVAWEPLGWEAAWVSEIEPFPCKVLAARFPGVPNLGDMTRLEDRILAGEVEAPDLLVGGTPCQAFSVAGLRGSLSDARGNLALVFVRLANAIDGMRERAGKPPCFVLWENVPGATSTRDNAFGSILGGLVGADGPIDPAGKWPGAGVVSGPARTAAWRILDAQFFGVAQHRRRVFVLARGGAGAWACADALLPLGPRGAGHPPARGAAREGAARGAAAGAGICVKGAAIGRKPENGPQFSEVRQDGLSYTLNCTETHAVTVPELAGTLKTEGFDASEDGSGRQPALVPELAGTLGAKKDGGWRGDLDSSGAYIPEAISFQPGNLARGAGAGPSTEVFPTLKADEGRGASDQKPCVAYPEPFTFDETQVTHPENRSQPQPGKPCHTLVRDAAARAVVAEPIPFDPKQIAHPANHSHPKAGDPCHPLRAVGNCEPAVAYQKPVALSSKDYGADATENLAPTLRAGHHDKSHANGGCGPAVAFHLTQDPISDDRITPALSTGSKHGNAMIGVAQMVAPLDLRNATRDPDKLDAYNRQGCGIGEIGDPACTLSSAHCHGVIDADRWCVRRLTPTECERLQGFPDGWTAIPGAADGPRYRALGNSMAVPVMRWIGRQVCRVAGLSDISDLVA